MPVLAPQSSTRGLVPLKDIILVPFWIKNTIERHQQPASSLLDLKVLYELTSPEDLIGMLELNRRCEQVFGTARKCDSLRKYWSKESELLKKLDDLSPLHSEGLQARLYNEAAVQDCYSEPFDIRDLDRTTTMVIIYPGHFGSKHAASYQAQLVQALLKLSYAYSSYDVMASDALFERYLCSL